MLMDEPTRGVDVGAKEEIFTLVRALSARGISVLFVSLEYSELIKVCDRIIVLNGGIITKEFDPSMVTVEELTVACSISHRR